MVCPSYLQSSERYVIDNTNALTKNAANELQSSLHDYTPYLKNLGFSELPTPAHIRVESKANMGGWLSSYDHVTGNILIDSSIVADKDSPRREYTHRILLHGRADAETEMRNPDMYLLESDLADYFVASFKGLPRLHQETPYLVSLDNQTTYDEAKNARAAWLEHREVWGGAFWAIRDELKAPATDKILGEAWLRMGPVPKRGNTVLMFVHALIRAADDFGPPEAQAKITSVLRQRKFPLSA